MAYAYCPKCDKSFRYKASADGGPIWLRELARSLGQGEQPVFLCYRCWVVPEVGDIVRIISPPEELPGLRAGAKGSVVEVRSEGSMEQRFVVESLVKVGARFWRCAFPWDQLQAAELPRGGTVQVSLAKPTDDT